MIVKFFRHGTGGGSAVFNYLLGKEGDRPDAEILRGDVEQQKRLIDSLDFKRQYTSGCLSFEEPPNYLSDQQKNEIMDGFEEVITAGLDADRVSFSWIEHRDKGRLELNFVIANVDLAYGRLFQPYIHSQDKKRVNAWKDLQNNNYQLSDPNEPLRKRLIAQRDNLPRAIKEIREDITNSLQNMAVEGLITDRSDVLNTLKDAGFEIARETPKAISIKNPDGGRNIRLTGGLYESDFKFDESTQAEVERDNRNYRDSSAKRLEVTTRLLRDELKRKRDYHQKRHGEPRHRDSEVQDTSRGVSKGDRHTLHHPYNQRQNPHRKKTSSTKGRDRNSDEKVFRRVERRNGITSSPCLRLHRTPIMGRGYRLLAYRFLGTDIGLINWNETGIKDHAKAVNAANQQGHESERGHHRAAEGRNQLSRASDRKIEEIIDGLGRNAREGTQSVADHVRKIREVTEREHERAKGLADASKIIRGRTDNLSRAADNAHNLTEPARHSFERVSEYVSTRQHAIERRGVIRDQYEHVKGDVKEYIGSAEKITERNTKVAAANDQRVGEVRGVNEGMKQTLEKQQAELTYSRPRMGR